VPCAFVAESQETSWETDRVAHRAQAAIGRNANGFDIESPVPGGVRMKLSGTSMASPQVANLAAKLLVLKPGLTPVPLKAAIVDGAERQSGADGEPGRVNLVNTRRSAELVGITL